MFTLKIFHFRYQFTGGNMCEIKKHLYFVKLIMWIISYTPLGNILADDPLSRMPRKGCIFDRRGGCQFTFLIKFTLASTAHERTTLVTLVSYKHNKAAKHGSSKPLIMLTTYKLWLLELWIQSTRILASIRDALWDMCKLSIGGTSNVKSKFLNPRRL